MQQTVDMISEYCPESDMYCLVTQRQFDPITCAIFTAKDLSKMAKTWNFHQELKSDSKQVLPHIFQCKMPPRFAIFSQSTQVLNKYDGGNTVIFEDKHKNKETFREKFFRKRTSGGVETPYQDPQTKKSIPSLIYYFCRKYAQIIDQVLEISVSEKSQEELKTTLNNQDSSSLTIEKLIEIGAKWEEKSIELPSAKEVKKLGFKRIFNAIKKTHG